MRSLLWCSALLISLFSNSVYAQDQEIANVSEFPAQIDFSLEAKEETHEAQLAFTSSVPVVDSSAFSINRTKEKASISARSFILPVALMGAGSICLINENIRQVNDFTKNRVYRPGYENKLKDVDDYTMIAPAVAVYALNFAGIKGRSNFVDRSIILTMSSLMTNGIVQSTKRLTRISRPDNSNVESFPSGHTASAFVAAEFMRQEYRNVSPWYGVAGYALAFSTGYLRMYHDKHWLNDVLAGAGVGILTTRFSYWIYPKIKKVIFPRAKSSTLVAPSYSNGAYGVTLVHSFN